VLTAKRDKKAALRFFEKAMQANGLPKKVTMDKSGANKSAIDQVIENKDIAVDVRQIKYLKNIVEQDHRVLRQMPI
jgi:putative transposase